MVKNIVIAILAVAVVVLGLLYIGNSANLGRFTDELNPKVFKDTVTFEGAVTNSAALTQSGAATFSANAQFDRVLWGGGVLTITATTSNIALTAAQVCSYGVINITPLTTDASTTLPTAATLAADCLPTAGTMKTLLIRNLATATTSEIGVTTGSSTLLLTAAGASNLAGGDVWTVDIYMATTTTGSDKMVDFVVEESL